MAVDPRFLLCDVLLLSPPMMEISVSHLSHPLRTHICSLHRQFPGSPAMSACSHASPRILDGT